MIAKALFTMSKPQICKLICELRSSANLTQEQLAAQLGVTFSSVSRWERGLSRPSPLAIQKIEEMLQKMGDRGKELLQKYLAE
jgi:transcriptional regulator with XRE-family HTH domain